MVQQHAATILAEVDASAGAALPQFVTDEFDASSSAAPVPHSFQRVRCRCAT